MATRLTRLERCLATRLNPQIDGSEHLAQSVAEDVSTKDLAREVSTLAETVMTRLAARLDADPAYVPPLRQVVKMADQVVRLRRLVFGEEEVGRRHSQAVRSMANSYYDALLAWAKDRLPPEVYSEVIKVPFP